MILGAERLRKIPRDLMFFRCRMAMLLIVLMAASRAEGNPYLAKPGEPVVPVRIATCAISGGFLHLYTALDNRLFDKYGIRPEFLLVRGAGVSAAALTSNELQFLYCTADAILPSLAAGAEAKMIASPLVGLPWVIVARKDIQRLEDLKGKTFLATRPGGTPDTLIRILMKRMHITAEELAIRHIGGAGQTEVYQALHQGVGHATMVTPPLDARAKRDGFNVVYHLDDLKLPAIYSSLFTNDRLIKERPAIAQKFVAALAEAVHFVENNPEKAKQSVSRVLALQDFDSAQSAYEAYAKRLINRRLTIPAARVKAAIDAARQAGANVRRKSAETFDNSFAEHLEKSGFIKDLWGAELPAKKW